MSEAHREGRIQDGNKPDGLLRERRETQFLLNRQGYSGLKRREPSLTRFLNSQLFMSVGQESGFNQAQAKILGKVLCLLIMCNPFSSVIITMIYISCTLHQVL